MYLVISFPFRSLHQVVPGQARARRPVPPPDRVGGQVRESRLHLRLLRLRRRRTDPVQGRHGRANRRTTRPAWLRLGPLLPAVRIRQNLRGDAERFEERDLSPWTVAGRPQEVLRIALKPGLRRRRSVTSLSSVLFPALFCVFWWNKSIRVTSEWCLVSSQKNGLVVLLFLNEVYLILDCLV